MWSHARASLAYSEKQMFFLYIQSLIFVFILPKISAKIFSNDCTKTKGSLKKQRVEGKRLLDSFCETLS